METWLIVGLLVAAIMVILSRDNIYFESFSIGLLTGLLVIVAEPLVVDWLKGKLSAHIYAQEFVLTVPLVFFFVAFFRYLPERMLASPVAAVIFSLTYSLVLGVAGLAGNWTTVVNLFFGVNLFMLALLFFCVLTALLAVSLKKYLQKTKVKKNFKWC